jgi:hypothetical protein
MLFGQSAAEIGFGSAGEIDRFVFSVYAKAIREIQPADRLRGAILIREPAGAPDALGEPSKLKTLLQQIQATATNTFHSLCLDLAGGLSAAYTCTPADRRSLVGGGWTQQVAQQFSRANKKCVLWATGVSAVVYLCGDVYLESPDVIEELPAGFPAGFQSLSWDDGRIIFHFANSDLNDTGPIGIWHLPANHLLRPKPEALIRSRLGKFLNFRLAGYTQHYEEAHVEHEGRADVSLHLIDGRVLIIEVKWIGCSLVDSRKNETEDAIKAAIAKNAKGWLTRFDETTIASGVRQLVGYYKTGKYGRAYLAVFDCASPPNTTSSRDLPVPAAELGGHSAENFRILCACVDPRFASKRAKSSSHP